MMKKGNKYRYSIKSSWTKRSDFPRGKYSRDHKFKALTGLYVDAKLKRSYNSKFIKYEIFSLKIRNEYYRITSSIKSLSYV